MVTMPFNFLMMSLTCKVLRFKFLTLECNYLGIQFLNLLHISLVFNLAKQIGNNFAHVDQ